MNVAEHPDAPRFAPLSSDRLMLRGMIPSDAEDLAVRRSDPATAQFQGWTIPYPLERAQALVAAVSKLSGPTPGEWFGVTAVEIATGAIVGDIAVFLADHGKTAEIGYTLHPWARGKGYATEAAARMIEHLVTEVGVHRIEASTDPRNAASNRVLERLGFSARGREARVLLARRRRVGRCDVGVARARVAAESSLNRGQTVTAAPCQPRRRAATLVI